MQGVNDRDAVSGTVTIGVESNAQQFDEQKEKFKKEARRLWKLKSEHIVKVHDLFEENGTVYYVMDYIEGESLAERLKRTGRPMSEQEVNKLLPQILNALREVHKNEMWHLDLKPGNIMVDKQGNAYLIDFGASKQIRANGSMTTSAALCYTPGYAPNEQIGQMYDRFGPWTDIYALGATIYNLLTNKKPPMAIDFEEDEEEAFAFPNSISENMRKLVIWLMQPKRKARPQSVEEVIELMEKLPKEDIPSPQEHNDESEDTILINPVSSKDNKAKSENQAISPKEDVVQEEEARTILVVSKSEGQTKTNLPPIDELPQRAIKVGDFIFEDGSYSNEQSCNNKKVIGVLFSYYGGAHGQILSPTNPSNSLSINGRKLEWHEASIGEWVEIIQNLGHCKVNFVSWEYKYYSDEVKDILKKFQISEARYATRKSVNGVSYIVFLERCTMIPMEISNMALSYIYISEF